MKDYLSQYLTDCGSRTDKDTRADELTKLTEPDIPIVERGFVSFVSDQSLDCPDPEREIAWRIEAMLPQVPEEGAIPFLVARATVERRSDCCHSCGEPLDGNPGYLCGFCCRAKAQAIEIAMRTSALTSGDLKKV